MLHRRALLLAALALFLTTHGAGAVCIPCEDACKAEGMAPAEGYEATTREENELPDRPEGGGRRLRKTHRLEGNCMCVGRSGTVSAPTQHSCTGDCCSQILEEGMVGATRSDDNSGGGGDDKKEDGERCVEASECKSGACTNGECGHGSGSDGRSDDSGSDSGSDGTGAPDEKPADTKKVMDCPQGFACDTKAEAKKACVQNGGQWVGSAWNIEDWCEACTGGPCTPLPMSDSSSHDDPNSGGSHDDHGAGTWKSPSPAHHDHGTGAPHATWKAPSPSHHDHGTGAPHATWKWKVPSPGSHADHGAGTWKVPSPAYHDHGTGAPHATWKAPSPGSYDDHGAGTWKSPSPAHHDHGAGAPHATWKAPSPDHGSHDKPWGMAPSTADHHSDHEGKAKCGARHNPADRDCCAPNGEEMFCHDGWVAKRNGKGCGSWVAANEWKEDPNGQFECHRPEGYDERAKFCGEGTEWLGSDIGCVATAEGAIRACERHRGEEWAFTCRPIDTCGDNHGSRYQNLSPSSTHW